MFSKILANIKVILESSRGFLGACLGHLLEHMFAMLDLIGAHVGSDLGHLGEIWGQVKGHIGIILEIILGSSGGALGSV